MYDLLIVTHLPAFYKINLYNEISKNKRIYVLFLGRTSVIRTKDFTGEEIKFDHSFLSDSNFESRNILKSFLMLVRVILSIKYRKILISGWDHFEYWALLLMNKKRNIALVLESTALESNSSGVKGALKRVFLKRVSTGFTPGRRHQELLEQLGFKGRVFITLGVGIINKTPTIISRDKDFKAKYLYVGRLSIEKNLPLLLSVFKRMKSAELAIAGEGDLVESLNFSGENIQYMGHVDNKKINELLYECDFLILPSFRETWGIVVEEALYFGRPVFLSSKCGAIDLIKNGVNGFIFDPYDENALVEKLTEVTPSIYRELIKGVGRDSINEKDKYQVMAYENFINS